MQRARDLVKYYELYQFIATIAAMDVRQWLEQAQRQLTEAGISTARLDALVLLEAALGKDRGWLLAHPESSIPADVQNVLNEQIARRLRHEPLAYIRGKSEFYGREFVVSPAVLEPRPESETMIDILLRYTALAALRTGRHSERISEPQSSIKEILKQVQDDSGQIELKMADVGTGSGALGITAYLELQKAGFQPENFMIDLLEIDESAREIAKVNVINNATAQKVIEADLLVPASKQEAENIKHEPATLLGYDILLCNLPYVPDGHTINPAAMFEPRLAIFGGPDGLDLYRRLYAQLSRQKAQPLLILCESLPFQHAGLTAIAAENGYRQDTEDDFIQAFVPA